MRTWLVPLFMAFFIGLISTEMLWEDVKLDGGYALKAPGHVLVEEGLCAMIPCTFTYNKMHVGKNEKLNGFWIKGTKYNSARILAEDRFQMIGNLTAGNCSLLILNAKKFDTGNYFFRMETEPKAKYVFFNFANPYLNVTERQSPEIQFLDTMRAGCSTNITCATFASCSRMPPSITWNGFPKPIDPHMQLNGAQVYSSVVNFLPSAADNKRNITCRVHYINETNPLPRETTVQLNVTYSKKTLFLTVTVALVMLAKLVLIIGIILASIRYWRKRKERRTQKQEIPLQMSRNPALRTSLRRK